MVVGGGEDDDGNHAYMRGVRSSLRREVLLGLFCLGLEQKLMRRETKCGWCCQCDGVSKRLLEERASINIDEVPNIWRRKGERSDGWLERMQREDMVVAVDTPKTTFCRWAYRR